MSKKEIERMQEIMRKGEGEKLGELEATENNVI